LEIFVEHDGRAYAADEVDARHRRPPGVASVHVRAVVTWCAIFPLVTVGMSIMSWAAVDWAPAVRALVLTVCVVPLAVYLIVPQLLRLYTALALAGATRSRLTPRRGRSSSPAPDPR
jgi:antibiotic biosynthesis monooxygenase (ABM) superfamily enzyme